MQYFTIGQIAKKLGVSVSTLKRWLKSGAVRVKKRRNASGWRLFSKSDVSLFQNYLKANRISHNK